MGIYDRDYYRKEGPSYLGSLIPTGMVCKWLIGINIAVFLGQLVTYSPPDQRTRQEREDVVRGVNGSKTAIAQSIQEKIWGPITSWLELDTAKVSEGQVWRLLTHAFLHSPQSLFHILFNMLFLWWFGSELETLYGSREFLAFYLVSALAGGLAFQAQAMVSGQPMIALGASGAVTSVVILYAFHFPHAVIYLFLLIPVPIWLFAVFNVAQDAYQMLTGARTDVGVAAHLGGAAFGALYFWQKWKITGFWGGMQTLRRERSRPKLRVYRPMEEAVAVGAVKSPPIDEHLDAQLDAVLEKLGRHGRDSLTDVEKGILQRASEIYKKKRS